MQITWDRIIRYFLTILLFLGFITFLKRPSFRQKVRENLAFALAVPFIVPVFFIPAAIVAYAFPNQAYWVIPLIYAPFLLFLIRMGLSMMQLHHRLKEQGYEWVTFTDAVIVHRSCGSKAKIPPELDLRAVPGYESGKLEKLISLLKHAE